MHLLSIIVVTITCHDCLSIYVVDKLELRLLMRRITNKSTEISVNSSVILRRVTTRWLEQMMLQVILVCHLLLILQLVVRMMHHLLKPCSCIISQT
jgi:hypothetical protein